MTKITRSQLIDRLKTIKLLALDVDGVLTDDSIYFGPDGFEMKKFNISDGFFIVLAIRSGLQIAVVSGRHSAATDTRMKDLGVRYILQGMKNKVEMIDPLLKELNIAYSEVAFMGNELLDIPLAEKVGLPIAVADASHDYFNCVAYITSSSGGHGAVREILECYFEATGKDPKSYII